MSSPSDITSVVWSAVNLPDGLTLGESTGIISGTPTTPGTYTTNVTVTTNWGTDTKAIGIIVAVPDSWKPDITSGQVLYLTAGEEMTPYKITGANIDKADYLSPLIAANDWHGIHEYVKANGVGDFVVGTEIKTTYTEPLGTNGGITYDLPCILVDKGTAITQNEDVVPALYFMSKYAIPCTAIYGNRDNSGIMFDNKEPSNSLSKRIENGSNRYMHSAIRQWLNSTGTGWWTAQHPADAAPDYTGRSGLLSCLAPSLVDELQPIRVQVQTALVDDSVIDVMYDKVFLPSLEEINRIDSSYGTPYHDTEGIEGHTWQYWKDKLGGTTRVGGGSSGQSVIRSLERNKSSVSVWLRSCLLDGSNGHQVFIVQYDYGSLMVTPASYTSVRALPCFAIIGA